MGGSSAAVVRKAHEDFARGNMSRVFVAFDAVITWRLPGHGPLSGDYTGHEQIGGFFRRTKHLYEWRPSSMRDGASGGEITWISILAVTFRGD
jgi:hypothetical protein